jgi:hypothetical protein
MTPIYVVSPTRLFAVVRQIAARQSATYKLAEDLEALREGWVARSLVLNLPDIIWAEVRPAEGASSELLLYSRSVYGYSDFGVNRRRVTAWVVAVTEALDGQDAK